MVWRRHDQEFLEELLRHEGLGSDTPSCCSCSAGSESRPSTPELENDREGPSAFIRCQDCCAGFVECTNCCLTRHQHLPFHRIEVHFILFYLYTAADIFLLTCKEVEWFLLGRNNAEDHRPRVPARAFGWKMPCSSPTLPRCCCGRSQRHTRNICSRVRLPAFNTSKVHPIPPRTLVPCYRQQSPNVCDISCFRALPSVEFIWWSKRG